MSTATYTPRTMAQVINDAAATYGDKLAISDAGVHITYRQLEQQRLRSAAAFAAAGVEKGDRFAIWAPNLHQWIIAAIGAQTIGAVLVPLNTRMKGPEAGYILRASGARMLFTVDEFLGNRYPELLSAEELPDLARIVLFSGDSPGCQGWTAFLESASPADLSRAQAMAAQVAPDDSLDILFTSGTTGSPKGVVTSHGQNIRAFETWSDTVGLTEEDNYLVINPFFHSFGYKAGWLASLIRGAHLFPVLNFDLDAVLAQIASDRISVIPGPPTIYQSLLAHPRRADYDLASLRLAVTGAAPVPVELINQMRSELHFETVVTAYGLTESCGVISICRPDDAPDVISHTSGCAMPGVEMICVDAAGVAVPSGEEGEIWARGYNVMQGYFNNPEETDRTITRDGWLKTGDIGVMDDSGYVRITDRLKDMFIVGGFNCYPAEIENLLCSMPGVARAAVIGVPDERLGEVPRAYLVATADCDLTEAAVIDWSRDNMANYKVPRSVVLTQELPQNAAGKVLKPELRKRAAREMT